MKKMISIDMKTLSIRKAGIGRYSISLTRNLLRRSKFKYYGIAGPETDLAVYQSLSMDQRRYFPIGSSLARATTLPFALPQQISLHHTLDNSCITPLRKKIKQITTIHDVLVFLYPQYFSKKHRLIVKSLTRAAVKWADHIITVSQATKQGLIKVFPKLHPDKITVIPLAAELIHSNSLNDHQFRLQNREFPKHYLLSLGTFEPRKNLRGLIQAYVDLKKRKKLKDVGLVLVGGRGWLDSGISADDDYLKKYEIYPLGFIEDHWLQSLYSNALGFVYPSIHEGFGLPPLEAMACGAPVIISNTSSLPEVGGDAALYVDPYSIESIQSAIESLVNDSSLRREMSRKSLTQSRKFSWDKTAILTEKIYNMVLGR